MKAIFLIVLFWNAAAFAKTPDSVSWQEWIPPGWKLIRSAAGDLNQDGKDDAALILEKDDPAKRRPNSEMGAPVLNLNPRRIVILFQTAGGYRKVVSTDDFLPSEHDAESPCLSDLLEEGGVQINRGLLKIDLHYWLSCGSSDVTHNTLTFRHENGRLRLIGLDAWDFSRSSGERTESSTNYLTGKQKLTTGLNEFEETKPETVWKSIPQTRSFFLDEIRSACDQDDNDGWCQ